MKLADVQIQDGSKYPHLSLTKLWFGEVGIKLYRIVFTDGAALYVEGEHDHPYVTDMYANGERVNVLPSDEVLSALNEEENNQ